MGTDSRQFSEASGQGSSVPPPGPPGRQPAIVLFLALLAAILTLYRTSERDLFTAHEARAACVARNMLESDHWPADKPNPWLVPQYCADASAGLNYQKPPLYYWAVALVSMPLGEVTNFTVRLPSAVSLVALVLITYWLGKTVVSVRTGFLAALVMVSTPKILWWGRAAILDPMLAACVAGSILAFFRAHTGRGGRWQYWLFWALAGLGTLVKATALVIPLLTVGVYLVVRARQDGFLRQLWRIKPISGPLVLAAVAAPWHVAAHLATAGQFSRIYWGIHVFGRATGTSVFEDNTYWWYYFPAMARDLFPWVVFLPGALVQPWREASAGHRGRLLLPGTWLVASLVFFSAVSFRKDEYMLVAYPAAAVLIGYFLDYYIYAHGQDAALRPWVGAAFGIVAAATFLLGSGLLAVAASPAVRQMLLDAFHNATDKATFSAVADVVSARKYVAALLTVPMMAGAAGAIVLIWRRRPAPAVGLVVAATVLAFAIFVDMIVPILGEARSLASFAMQVDAHARRGRREISVVLAVEECHELAFLLHRRSRTLDSLGGDFRPFVREQLALGRQWMVVTDRRAWQEGRWNDPAIQYRLLAESHVRHRRPMVLLEPVLVAAQAGNRQ